jgi:hypothetical protein
MLPLRSVAGSGRVTAADRIACSGKFKAGDQLHVVVLPQPDGPRRVVSVPASTAKETLLTAVVAP